MRSRAIRLAVFLNIGLLLAQTGCQSGAPGASFLSLFGLSQKPVVIALLVQPGVLNPFGPREELRKAMSASIHRPVRLDLCLPIQLEPNLDLGFYDFAVVSPACYAGIRDRQRFEVIAVAADEEGRVARRALLVVADNSDIQAVSDLRGKRVAFGPPEDSRTHYAALALLREQGIKKNDLSLSLLPVPASLRHFTDARQLVQSVLDGASDAGFIDEADLEALPQSATGTEPARDKLRVIARTIPIAESLVIRSPKVAPDVLRNVTQFLLSAGKKHREALRPLLLSGYQEPDAEVRACCDWLAGPAEPATTEPGLKPG